MKQRILRTGFASFVFATALLLFNNCSDVGFSGDSGNTSSSGGGNPGNLGLPNDPTQPPPDVAVKNCATAMSNGSIKTHTQTIRFEDTKVESGRNNVCLFNQGDNLSPLNEFIRARYDQYTTLNLPPGAVVCDIEMNTPTQQFRYDDVFFLTFNGRVLATNDNTALRDSPSGGNISAMGMNIPSIAYDWMSVREEPFQNNVRDDYCLGRSQGAANCTWPLTQQTGNIVFDFAPEIFLRLALTRPVSQQTFGFTITGDNDPSDDCFHERLEFSMSVKYYQQ